MNKDKKIIVSDIWYEYDWRFKNADAVFSVNTQYEEDYESLGDVLVIIECRSSRKVMTDGEYRRYENLRDKLLKKLDIVFVGLIESLSCVRFYFYANTGDIAIDIEKYIKHIANHVSCECKFDKEKTFYLNTLLPDAAKRYTEENRKQLKTFYDNGDNTEAVRKLNFHLLFPSEPLRILFEEQARLAGYAIGETEFIFEQDLPHSIVVHKMLSLVKSDVDDATTQLVRIAEKYDGILGFWDCVLVPKRKNL